MMKLLSKIFGTKHERELKRLKPMIVAINDLEEGMKELSDEALRRKTREFWEKLDNGATVEDIKFEAFAVCREAGRRVLGMRHYDVQLFGGMILHEGKIAEMKTGEGKTLVATLPCYLNALERKGVHVVTVNDYLARRDAEWMGRLHGFLGLSTGVVLSGQGDPAKKRAYRCDITYGQNNEFGFDYLRDNMKFSIYDYAQRELHYAIVDEVDSILVDEARTPLIISGPGESASEKYQQINAIIPRLRKDDHYVVDEKARSVSLTEEGIILAQKLAVERGITKVENLYEPVNLETLHILNQSLRAHTLYKRDQQYMVSPDGKVMIIDEFTGRTLKGRRWSDGLHQAVEAKEEVNIQDESRTLATISFQNLFRLYKKLSGMTGTADTEAVEFNSIYKLDVVVIPTNRPIQRKDDEDLVYKTEREKFNAIVDDIVERRDKGQPVLVGTTSVEKSDALHQLLERKQIPHNVLNAKQHEREAYVVAQAGKKGSVTVATNMAGRGTDILLGGNPEMLARVEVMQQAPPEVLENPAALETAIKEAIPHYEERCKNEKKEVLEAGGLHILGTERHESRRIDNQLRGRAGRQGDPGSSRFFLSLEDDLMRIFAGDRIQTMMDRMGMEEGVPIEHKWVTKAVENAQQKVEERNFDIRKNLLEYDDVMNQQRKSVYTLRKQVLMGEYRTTPTEDEIKKGATPQPVVSVPNEDLRARAKPIIEQMMKHHGSPLPPKDATPEQLDEARLKAQEAKIEDLTELRVKPLERDVYVWFGCQISLDGYTKDPQGAYDLLSDEVALSLTEQRERLLDLIDEIVGTMVDHACPPGKNFEDWDLDGLAKAFKEQFGIEATGIERLSDAEDVAAKLYKDAEAILLKKEDEFGSESYLRLFRNFYMQEIDKQWIDHLQNMDHLRDGIGLRGYGQRDPKKEYKREGYDLFVQMTQSVKGSVAANMFRVVRVTEDDLRRQEEQRRRVAEERERALKSLHAAAQQAQPSAPPGARPAGQAPAAARALAAAAAAGAAQSRAPSSAPPAGRASSPGSQPPSGAINRKQRRGAAARGTAAPVAAPPSGEARRERPKVGRNEPCWCGSGKKYKQCHLAEDQARVAE